MDPSRREFLLKVAKGAAYAAPVIASMAAPEALLASQTASQKAGGGSQGGGKNPNLSASTPRFQTGQSGAPPAPWSLPPDGGTKAPWNTSSGSGSSGTSGGGGSPKH